MNLFKIVFSIVILGMAFSAVSQDDEASEGEQDRESQAMDATATQWSFQLAYQMDARLL